MSGSAAAQDGSSGEHRVRWTSCGPAWRRASVIIAGITSGPRESSIASVLRTSSPPGRPHLADDQRELARIAQIVRWGTLTARTPLLPARRASAFAGAMTTLGITQRLNSPPFVGWPPRPRPGRRRAPMDPTRPGTILPRHRRGQGSRQSRRRFEPSDAYPPDVKPVTPRLARGIGSPISPTNRPSASPSTNPSMTQDPSRRRTSRPE